jgi:hypothetical protein
MASINHMKREVLGSELVFYDPLNVMSYAMARLKSDNIGPGGGTFLARGHILFCSRECVQAAAQERRTERRRQDRERKAKPIKCEQCGSMRPPERSTRRYCSDVCRQKAYRRRILKFWSAPGC